MPLFEKQLHIAKCPNLGHVSLNKSSLAPNSYTPNPTLKAACCNTTVNFLVFILLFELKSAKCDCFLCTHYTPLQAF